MQKFNASPTWNIIKLIWFLLRKEDYRISHIKMTKMAVREDSYKNYLYL
jgi:hypothetical protein